MFTHFESSDERERKTKTEERLDSLRRAYEAGYFKEEGSEPFVLARDEASLRFGVVARLGPRDPDATVIICDGAGPDDAGPTAYGFNTWKQQAAYRNGGTRTGRVYHAGSEDCPTCGRPRVMFVDGDCPGCNPPLGDDQGTCDWPVDATGERLCAVCRGAGILFSGNRCSWCDGSGKETS